ncbi:MAG: hypothetical protein K6C08_04700, partial [Oscillospiraceae bacterium]|nr:hypothetical protein [Oscillospiraceae bacterium]
MNMNKRQTSDIENKSSENQTLRREYGSGRKPGTRLLSLILIISMVFGMFPFETAPAASAEALPEGPAVTETAAAADGGTEQTATEAGEPAAEETPAAAETPAPTPTPAPVTLNLGNTFDLSEGVLLSEVLEELKLPVTLKEISKVVLEDD